MWTIHGLKVIGWVQTEVQDGKACGIILVHKVRDKVGDEWVTAWWREGDNEWCGGHYFSDRERAMDDFIERAKLELGFVSWTVKSGARPSKNVDY